MDNDADWKRIQGKLAAPKTFAFVISAMPNAARQDAEHILDVEQIGLKPPSELSPT